MEIDEDIDSSVMEEGSMLYINIIIYYIYMKQDNPFLNVTLLLNKLFKICDLFFYHYIRFYYSKLYYSGVLKFITFYY